MEHRMVLPPLPPAKVLALPGRGEIFYRHHEGGDPGAPTVLLLHGWTTSADLQWFTAYEALGARFPFLAVDHRGHGRGIRSEEPFALEDAADDAAELVRLLGLGPVVVAGYSMGGPISLLLWHRHPELVAGLVLEATALEWRANASDRMRWWGLVALEWFLRSRLSRWWNRKTVRKMADGNPAIEGYLAWITAEARRGDPAAITEAGRALSQYDARPFAGAVDVPTAVVLTTDDKLVKPRRQMALAEATQAEIVELHGDHFAHWAAAADFAKATVAAVEAVVSRVPAPASAGRAGTPGGPRRRPLEPPARPTRRSSPCRPARGARWRAPARGTPCPPWSARWSRGPARSGPGRGPPGGSGPTG